MANLARASIYSFVLFFSITSFANTTPVDPSTHSVVQYLNDNGIEVEIFNVNTPTLPGEPTFNEKVRAFWDKLDLVKEQIVDRSEFITMLTLSSYTKGNVERQQLTIDVDHTKESMERYFPLFDKKVSITQNIKLDLVTGIDLYRIKDQQFINLETLLGYWDNNISKVNDLASIIREIEVNGNNSYMFLLYGKMKLSEETYKADFEAFYADVSDTAKVFASASELGVKIELNFDLDKPAQKVQFEKLSEKLQNSASDMASILESNLIEEMSFAYFRDENTYHRSLKKLRMAGEGDGLNSLNLVLEALSKEVKLAADLDSEMDAYGDDLDSDYIESVEMAERLRSSLLTKKDKIETLYFNYYNPSKFSNGTLYLHNDNSDSDVKNVINSI